MPDPAMGTYRFPFDLRSLLALVALSWLASFAHEFTHHASGAFLCGGVGRMSLSLFANTADCGDRWPWTTAAGPALSYVLMWFGMALVLRGRHVWWGFALVIANKPVLRLLTAAMGGGDEGVLWDLLSPVHGRWFATATVVALSLPPLWACWRALVPRRRALVLVAALLLPMLPILPVPFIDRAIYGEWIGGTATLPAAFGVPWSVWAIEAGVLALLLVLRVTLPRARPAALTAS
jgi:hypothetical protein